VLHRLAEGILTYKLDQITADPKCCRVARKKIDQQIVHGPEC